MRVVEELAARNARLVVVARDAERLHGVVDSLGGDRNGVYGLTADITRQEDVDRLFAEAMEHLGKLDLLVNCAGRSDRASVLDTTPGRFRDLIELNLLGTVRCTRAAVNHLVETGGHLVNIGSLAAKIATPFHGAYPVSKFAVAGYTQQLRLLLKPDGVHVLLVCPGPIARRESGGSNTAVVSADIPAASQGPGAGAKIRAIDPADLATRILGSCERRRAELIVPGRAKILCALSAVSPRLGDWLVRRYTPQ